MELGAQGSLTPYTSVEERAKQICERILTRPEPWDVLCFYEVFDEDGRDVLERKLRTTTRTTCARPTPTTAARECSRSSAVSRSPLAAPCGDSAWVYSGQ
jgi:hypothetical protein